MKTRPKAKKLTFQNVTELQNWLIGKDFDLSTWGHNTTKTINHLWNELCQEDIYLQDDPPMRVSNVVCVIIPQADNILVEVAQEFQDNQYRTRNLPPSEKMKAQESVEEAAIRCLQEELGVPLDTIQITQCDKTPQMRIAESPSYPGLKTHYTVYTVTATVTGLPQTDFCTSEASTNHTDPVSKHHWAWKRASDVNIFGENG